MASRNRVLKRTIGLIVAAGLVVSSIGFGALPAAGLHDAANSPDWPTERGDAARTGATDGSGPAGPYADTDWRLNPGGRVTGAVIANETLFVSTETWDEYYVRQTGALTAYDSETGEVIWNRTDLAAVEEDAAVANGTVFVAVTAVPDEETGNIPDATGKAGLFALDAETGETVWKTEPLGDWSGGGSTTVVNETVYVASDYRVLAYDAATGEREWQWQNSGPEQASGFAVHDGSVYVTHGNVSAIDAASGEIDWTTSVPSANGPLSGPAVADGSIYLASQPDLVHRLSTDGEVEWTVELENSLNNSNPNHITAPAVSEGAVFVSTDDDFDRNSVEGQRVGTIHRLDADNGSLEWRFETKADVETAPAVTDQGVFVPVRWWDNSSTPSFANAAIAVNRSDGSEQWNYALGAPSGTDHWETILAGNERVAVVSNSDPYPLTFDGFVAVLNSSQTRPEPFHQLAPDEPEQENRYPLVSITSNPPEAENYDFDQGDNVTLTANATDVDGNVTSIQWDVDADGTYERPGEQIVFEVDYCGTREVTVRVSDDGFNTTESIHIST